MPQDESQPQLVLATTPVARVRVLTLNRPAKRNALSQDLIQELLSELSKASSDPDVRAVIITGGTSFFSGKRVT
ncbi:enoyl-CoA hydratase/isomerase family protein [Candidatus Bathyarchaeota archaeon]|nr:enoyl-CoA hydratase/isomerase family protein [Candidatus Bathyarchaeota archaeon]